MDSPARTTPRPKRKCYAGCRSLREDATIKHWFTCTKTRFNIRAAIDDHKVIVLNNSRGDPLPMALNSSAASSSLRSRLLANGARQGDPRNVPTIVYIDECDQVIKADNNIEDYVDKLRSKSIGVVLAHQRLSHFSGNTQTLDALLNAPIRFANVDDDAKALADRLRVQASSSPSSTRKFCRVRSFSMIPRSQSSPSRSPTSPS